MNRKILYFDKQRSFRDMLLSRICEECKEVDIIVTSNIMELMLYSKKDHFALILIDLHSIDSDITETIKLIKRFSRKEIIALASNNQNEKAQSLEAGVKAVIDKYDDRFFDRLKAAVEAV